MIGENRHLTDNATLNKHREVPSESYTKPLPILTNQELVDHHLPLRLLTNLSWSRESLLGDAALLEALIFHAVVIILSVYALDTVRAAR